MIMKRFLLLMGLGAFIYACTPARSYELIGTQGRKPFYPELPVGMVYIPAGGFTMGLMDQDIFQTQDAKHKTVSVASFYMDQTEITNNEYRQFVDWVRDSIALEKLALRASGKQSKDGDIRGVADYINFEQDVLFLKTQTDDPPFIDYYDNINQEDTVNYWDEPSEDYFLEENFETDAGELIDLIQTAYEADPADGRLRLEEARKMLSLNWYDNPSIDYSDPRLMPLLVDMYLPSHERYFKRREIDTRKLIYEYYWIDYVEAAKKGKIGESAGAFNFSATPQAANSRVDGIDGALLYNKNQPEINPSRNNVNRGTPINKVNADGSFSEITDAGEDETGKKWSDETKNEGFYGDGFISGKDQDIGFLNRKMGWNAYRGHSDRSRFIIHEKIAVYPDTLCWVHDFTYSNNDDMANMYFWNTAYDNYPVVGITWKQAKAFSVWRTQLMNSYLVSNGDVYVNNFRLPSEAEWERAARGDLALESYPWGGPYIRNASGCFLGNFKPMRGRYFEDGGLHTVKVFSYNPNNFGLFCMAGNVSEWCESAYDESSYEFMHDLNPEYRYDAKKWDPPVMKRKVIRGGSWKDIGHYLQVGARSYEYQDTAKCYIGFRNVMTHLGRGGKDFTKEGGEEIQSDIQLR